MNLASQAEAGFEVVKVAQEKITLAVNQKKEKDIAEEKARQEAEEIKRMEEEKARQEAEAAAAAAEAIEREKREAEIRERQRTIIRKDGLHDSSSDNNNSAVLQPVLSNPADQSQPDGRTENQTEKPSVLRRR